MTQNECDKINENLKAIRDEQLVKQMDLFGKFDEESMAKMEEYEEIINAIKRCEDEIVEIRRITMNKEEEEAKKNGTW